MQNGNSDFEMDETFTFQITESKLGENFTVVKITTKYLQKEDDKTYDSKEDLIMIVPNIKDRKDDRHY